MIIPYLNTFRISKPYPRKGTETRSPSSSSSSSGLFQNHIPARGRKPNRTNMFDHHNKTISKPYPRKGTETRSILVYALLFVNFKTISPQGDGNIHQDCISAQETTISKPYPRKGTETRSCAHDGISSIPFQNHIPARGRKH